MSGGARQVALVADGASLAGDLTLPHPARGIVLFAHGSGSSRHSPRNQFVAAELNRRSLGTLLMDLLTPAEERADAHSGRLRFDVGLLADRLAAAMAWLEQDSETAALPLGLFGASTGAAAALAASVKAPEAVRAIVSRGGRPDLAGDALPHVSAPCLLLVGSRDAEVLELNRRAAARMPPGVAELRVVEGASHLFEEPGTLEEVAKEAGGWFERHLAAAERR